MFEFLNPFSKKFGLDYEGLLSLLSVEERESSETREKNEQESKLESEDQVLYSKDLVEEEKIDLELKKILELLSQGPITTTILTSIMQDLQKLRISLISLSTSFNTHRQALITSITNVEGSIKILTKEQTELIAFFNQIRPETIVDETPKKRIQQFQILLLKALDDEIVHFKSLKKTILAKGKLVQEHSQIIKKEMDVYNQFMQLAQKGNNQEMLASLNLLIETEQRLENFDKQITQIGTQIELNNNKTKQLDTMYAQTLHEFDNYYKQVFSKKAA